MFVKNVCLTFVTLTIAVSSESMIDWLLSPDRVSPELSITHDIASRMERSRLEGLAAQATGGLVMVLPTNAAWLEFGDLYDKLMTDTPQSQKLRNDVVFAAGGEMDKVGGFEDLLAYAEQNDGVVDTAFGTPIKIEPSGKACIADYDADWNLVTSACSTLRLPPVMFDDGAVYLTDKIILPESLMDEIAA